MRRIHVIVPSTSLPTSIDNAIAFFHKLGELRDRIIHWFASLDKNHNFTGLFDFCHKFTNVFLATKRQIALGLGAFHCGINFVRRAIAHNNLESMLGHIEADRFKTAPKNIRSANVPDNTKHQATHLGITALTQNSVP
jgi:hypothetical protein